MSVVLIVVNSAWNVANFRAGLVKGIVDAGYTVVAAAPEDEHVSRLKSLGCGYIPLPMEGMGKRVDRDLMLMFRLWVLMRREKPSVVLTFTIKPNIYATIVASVFNIPVINNIAGLGTLFTARSRLTIFVERLFKFALKRSRLVFFQNEDDMAHFIQKGLVPSKATFRLPGSGVNVDRFTPGPNIARDEVSDFKFLLVGRVLWEKGIGEYVEAARLLREEYPAVQFQVLGFLDVENPGAVPREIFDEWVGSGDIKYLGSCADVRPHLHSADCIVLPSYYREGVPKSLLEAAACCRPIITTNSVGCADAVVHMKTGLLCEPRSVESLVGEMRRMMRFTTAKRIMMGKAGRKRVEAEFDERIVVNHYIEAISGITLR